MPFRFPFNFLPFNNYYRRRPSKSSASFQSPTQSSFISENVISYNNTAKTILKNPINAKDSENFESSESFFEIFGLKLYLDDILIICILFFLYSEKVQDDELFICLILLLFS